MRTDECVEWINKKLAINASTVTRWFDLLCIWNGVLGIRIDIWWVFLDNMQIRIDIRGIQFECLRIWSDRWQIWIGNGVLQRTCYQSAYETKFCPVFSWLHCKGHLKSQYNFFCRIFVTPFLVEIFRFIAYANNTTCDVTLHNDFWKKTNLFRSSQTIANKWGSLIISRSLRTYKCSFIYLLLLYGTK